MAHEQRDNSGVLFQNRKRTSDKAPSMRGHGQPVCPHCGAVAELWISAWTKDGEGGKFLSLSFQPKEKKTVQQKIDQANDPF